MTDELFVRFDPELNLYILEDSISKYELRYDTTKKENEWSELLFTIPYYGDITMNETRQPITGFDLSEMPNGFQEEVGATDHVVEVGCGLGEFIHYLSKRENAPPSIAIDLADYNILEKMLNYASELENFQPVINRITVFQNRITELKTNSKIRFLNMPLSQVLEQHPEMINSADIVIDHGGAIFYPHNEPKDVGEGLKQNSRPYQTIIELEKKLLKLTGKILSVDGNNITHY